MPRFTARCSDASSTINTSRDSTSSNGETPKARPSPGMQRSASISSVATAYPPGGPYEESDEAPISPRKIIDAFTGIFSAGFGFSSGSGSQSETQESAEPQSSRRGQSTSSRKRNKSRTKQADRRAQYCPNCSCDHCKEHPQRRQHLNTDVEDADESSQADGRKHNTNRQRNGEKKREEGRYQPYGKSSKSSPTSSATPPSMPRARQGPSASASRAKPDIPPSASASKPASYDTFESTSMPGTGPSTNAGTHCRSFFARGTASPSSSERTNFTSSSHRHPPSSTPFGRQKFAWRSFPSSDTDARFAPSPKFRQESPLFGKSSSPRKPYGFHPYSGTTSSTPSGGSFDRGARASAHPEEWRRAPYSSSSAGASGQPQKEESRGCHTYPKSSSSTSAPSTEQGQSHHRPSGSSYNFTPNARPHCSFSGGFASTSSTRPKSSGKAPSNSEGKGRRFHPYTKASASASTPMSTPGARPTPATKARSSNPSAFTSTPRSAPVHEPSSAFAAAAAARSEPFADLSTVFASYDTQWALLSSASTRLPLSSAASIPWPLLTSPRTAAGVTSSAVRAFLLHARRPMASGDSAKVRKDALLRFHPDKFSTRVLERFVAGCEAEREQAREIAEAVTRALTGWDIAE